MSESLSSEARAPRVAATTLAGAAAFAGSYLFVPAWGVPRLIYHPLRRVFLFAVGADGPAMSYYGLVLWSSLAFAAAFGVTWAWTSRRPPTEATVTTLASTALSLTALAVAYNAWHLLSTVH